MIKALDKKKIFSLSLIGLFILAWSAESLFAQRNRVSKNTRINRLIDKGAKQIDIGNFSGAIETFDQCISLKPTFYQGFDCYFGRGLSYLQIGQDEKALADFNSAEKNKPGDKTTRFFRGRANLGVGNYEEALRDFDFVEVLSTEKELLENFSGIYADRGLTNIFLKRFAAALTDFNKAVEINPLEPFVYISRSLALENLGKPEEALKDLQKALELNPNVKPIIEENLARINETLNDSATAEDFGVDPETEKIILGYIEKIDKEFEADRPQAALDILNGIEDKKIREHPFLYVPRGVALIYLKKFDEGDAYFTKMFRHTEEQAHSAFKNAAELKSGTPNAFEDYENYLLAVEGFYGAIVKTNNTRRAAYENINIENPQPANIEGFAAAMKSYADALTKLGEFYSYRKRSDEALEKFNKAIEISPDWAMVYHRRGTFFFFLEKYEKAFADFNKVIELEPKNPLGYRLRGSIHSGQKDWDAAIADYTKATELAPNDATLFSARGDIYRFAGKHALAVLDYTKAVELDEKAEKSNLGVTIYWYRGKSYAGQGKYELAIADYTKVINKIDTNKYLFADRAEAFCKLGETEKAKADQKKALELGGKLENPCQ